MNDDVNAALREIADLLRQRVQQSSDMMQRADERLARMPTPRAVPDLAALEAKHEHSAKEARDEAARRRVEDVEFRERILAALERQNELLARILDRP